MITKTRATLEDLYATPGKAELVNGELVLQTQRLQATLFEAEHHPVLDELESLDLGTLSPIESLTEMYELQRKLTGA